MTAQINSIAAVEPLDHVDMSDQNAAYASQLNASQVLADSMTTALDSALHMPAVGEIVETSEQHVLNKSGENDFMGDEVGEERSPVDEITHVAEKVAGIYADMTAFHVAWGIAKKSGRDVETLLKGQ